MRTPMKPSTMTSKQPSHAGFYVRISAGPAPAFLQSRYPRAQIVAPAFRGSFDWRQYPGLF